MNDEKIEVMVNEGIEEKSDLDLIVNESKQLVINTQDDYERAVEFLRGLKDFQKKLDARYEPIKDQTHKTWKMACQLVNDYQKPIDAATRTVKRNMSEYTMRKERERRAEIERRRKEAEEKERARVQAELQECGFDKKEAEKEAEKVEVAIPKIEIKDDTKTEGVSYRENWDFEFVDIDKIPREYLIPDDKKIRGVVKAMKNNTNIPGIKAVCHKIPIVR